MIRWPFRKRVTETVTPTVDEVAAAASALSRHRAQAQHEFMLAKTRAIRAELGMSDEVRFLA